MASDNGLQLARKLGGWQFCPVGLAAGVTLAPTSVGMALKMLGEKKQLGEEYGQLIVTVRRRTLRPDRAR